MTISSKTPIEYTAIEVGGREFFIGPLPELGQVVELVLVGIRDNGNTGLLTYWRRRQITEQVSPRTTLAIVQSSNSGGISGAT